MRLRATEPFTKAVTWVLPAVVSSLCVVAGLQRVISFLANSKVSLLLNLICQAYYLCTIFYSYSRIGTNGNSMEIRMWTVLWITIRKARNHCQDEDHCQYHLRMEKSTQMIKTSGLP